MNKEIMKKLKREMRLNACLDSIKEYSNTTIDYLTGEYEINDLNELIASLASIPEYIEEVEQIILEMNEEYEKEIEVLNEQL